MTGQVGDQVGDVLAFRKDQDKGCLDSFEHLADLLLSVPVDDDRSAKAARVVAILTVVPALIGFGLAAALAQACNANHVLTKIALVRVYDLQWLYLALFVLCRAVSYLIMYPMVFI